MQPRIMITNGGVHPADKWAAITAAEIVDLIQINEGSESPAAVAARKAKPRLEIDIADLMETYHGNVQKHERALLEAKGEAQLAAPLDPAGGEIDTPEEVVAEIVKLAANTPFAAHFATEEVKAVLRKIVDNHFGLSIDIERSTYADHHGDTAGIRAYRAARVEHGPRNVHLFAGDGGKGKRPAGKAA